LYPSVTNRLSDQAKVLQNALNSVYAFDAERKDFCLWMTKMELVQRRSNDISSGVPEANDFAHQQVNTTQTL